MHALTQTRLKAYRARTFRLSTARKVTTTAQALEFVNERGFVYFWPIKGVVLPSLWVAVAGDRPVADEHDDPGHVTWGWKDQALGKKRWYYAKMLRRKATLIAMEVAPYFYALSENYGAPEEDHLVAYREGRLTLAAKLVYEALLKEGRLNTIDLRRAAHLTSKGSNTEFNRALEVLQADFKILPVGVAEAGAWHYAYIYDVTARHMPELVERARAIGEAEARQILIERYFRSVGAAQLRDAARLFGWKPELAARAVSRLVEKGLLQEGVEVAKQKGSWIIHVDLAG
jgi:hypothetical protein